MRRLSVILGIPVDDVTLEEALDRIEGFLADGSRLRQVATANTDFLVRALHDEELRRILRRADLVTADGMPLVWASHLLGGTLRERVAGSDLVPALAQRCAQTRRSLFLLGARPEVAQTAARRLEEAYPGVRIAGVFSPPPADLEQMDHAEIVRRVNQARPDVLLVAFGNPKQEKWVDRQRHALEVPVAIGIGATLDFLAGKVARAPRWMQRHGLEWAWRLGREPSRLWRRYLNDFVQFAPRVAGRGAWMQAASRWARLLPDGEAVRLQGDTLRLTGRLSHAESGAVLAAGGERLARGGTLRVEARVRYIDSAGLGCLFSLAHQAREVGGRVRLEGVSPHLRRRLRAERMEQAIEEVAA